jgi:hypothetical protein
MNESSIFGPGVDELWLQTKRKRSRRANYGLTSGTKLPIEIAEQLGDAEKHFIEGNNEEAIKALSQVTKAAPRLAEPYKLLALIYEQIYADEQLLQLYALSATLMLKDLILWEKVYYFAKKLNEFHQALYAINRCINLSRDRKVYYQERLGIFIKLGRIIQFRDAIKQFYVKFSQDNFIYLYVGDQFYSNNYFKYSIQYYTKFLLIYFPKDELSYRPSTRSSSTSSSSTENPLLALFKQRNALDSIIYDFNHIIYAIHRITRVFFEMDDYQRILVMIDNFFTFFQPLKEFYYEHYQEYVNLEEQDNDFQDGMMQDLSPKMLVPEEFPMDLLLLLGLVKLLLYKHETDITSTLLILNPLLQSIQQNYQEFFPLKIGESNAMDTDEPQEGDLAEILEKHASIQDLYDFIPSTSLTGEQEMDEELSHNMDDEKDKEKALELKKKMNEKKQAKLLAKIMEENKTNTFRNLQKENELIHLNMFYYCIIIGSLFSHLGMIIRSTKFFAFLYQVLLSYSFTVPKEFSSLLIFFAYELESVFLDDEKAMQITLKALEIDPFSLEALNFCSYLLLKSRDSTKIYQNISHFDDFLRYFVEDFEKLTKKTIRDEESKKLRRESRIGGKEEEEVDELPEKEEKEKKAKKQKQKTKKKAVDETEGDESEEKFEEELDEEEEEGDFDENEDLEKSFVRGKDQSAQNEVSLPVEEETDPNLSMMEEIDDFMNFIEGGNEGIPAAEEDEEPEIEERAQEDSPQAQRQASQQQPVSLEKNLLVKYLKHLRFPLLSNKFSVHRLFIQQLLEFLMNYLQLLVITTDNSNEQNYFTKESSFLTREMFQMLMTAINQSIIKSFKTRVKTRENIDMTIFLTRITQFYNHYEKDNLAKSGDEKATRKLISNNPFVNSISTFAATHSTMTAEKKFEEGRCLYGLIQFLSEYVAIDYFFKKSNLFEMISLFQSQLEQYPRSPALSPAHEKHVQDEIQKCLQVKKIYDSYYHEPNYQNGMYYSHGFSYFYKKYQSLFHSPDAGFNQENNTTNNNMKIPFYFHSNIQNSLQSFLQDHIRSLSFQLMGSSPGDDLFLLDLQLPANKSAQKDRPEGFLEVQQNDKEIEYLRKNINLRSLRGRGKKQSNYDSFLEAAGKISTDCQELAKIIYHDPNDSNAFNLLYRTIVHQMVQQQNQNDSHSSSSSTNKLPFLSLLTSLSMENTMSMKPLTLLESSEIGTSTSANSAYVHYLMGNEQALFKRHNDVVENYLKAFLADSTQPMIALTLACYLIMLSTHPLTKDRMNFLIKGFGFLYYYQDLRLKYPSHASKKNNSTTSSAEKMDVDGAEEEHLSPEEEIRLFQETLYNLGRAFHEIKFYHLACFSYRQCLKLADQHSFLKVGRSVTLEAAHNLVLIYRKSNAKDLAFSIMRNYLSFPT